MFALLITAFLPKVGYQFSWVTYHWIAGLVLTASIIFHIIPRVVLDGLLVHLAGQDRHRGRQAALAARHRQRRRRRRAEFAKYPMENKMYHLIIVLAGLAVILTGLFMMKRVRTPFFTRNPYLFSDMTWGMMYVLHGLAGVGSDRADHGPYLLRAAAGEVRDHRNPWSSATCRASITSSITIRSAGPRPSE